VLPLFLPNVTEERSSLFLSLIVPSRQQSGRQFAWLAKQIGKTSNHSAMVGSHLYQADRAPFITRRAARKMRGRSRSGTRLKHTRTSSATFFVFSLWSDERQYCSPGFNLPVGCLMRSVGYFPEYTPKLTIWISRP